MNETLAYYPRIEDISAAQEFTKTAQGHYVLFGEYGILPLVLKIDEKLSPRPLYEIILSDKNRMLFINTLLSAHATFFSGAVISSGQFEKKDNMPMPVFDLDTTQALCAAVELKKKGTLPADFLLGVRAASGSETAELRARKFIDLGADFIVLSNAKPIHGLESHTMFLKTL